MTYRATETRRTLLNQDCRLVCLLIGGCTDKTCRQRVGTYACIRFVDGIVGSSRVSHEGSVDGRAYCAHPTRSPWVGKYTTVGTHSGGGEWSDDDGGGDSEGHEKSIKERGVGVAAGMRRRVCTYIEM
ncbi:hypothetical protein DBV15_10113 [Temnothorax longispinosus]|uniref:Uncharacterized protein n=1 Tax=Temnothorax longispinosus TaxID=300112 RepID=A0A4S2J9L9_9HYME|nr:hypothetical protein DBV15_10113 [Temnothorax longispinosus]